MWAIHNTNSQRRNVSKKHEKKKNHLDSLVIKKYESNKK